MIWLASLALLAPFFSGGLASPMRTNRAGRDDISSSKRDPELTVENLTNEFKGIHWDHIFKKSGDCTIEQRDKIIYSTRAAMWLTEPVADDMEYAYSTAWTRYFGDYNNWLGRSTEIEKTAGNIQFNIMQAAKYPRQGRTKRNAGSASFKLHYTCEPADHGDAAKLCGSGHTLAVTVPPEETQLGVWLVVFCPFFFSSDKLVYLQERADGDPKTPAQIGGLDTYERAIVHEFMHVGMFSYRNKIVDIVGKLWDDEPALRIYGDVRCRDFAKRLDNGKPNTEVYSNADSYSWFFTYYYFDKRWGWTTPKHDELKKAGTPEQEQESVGPNVENDIVIPEPSFPVMESDLKVDFSLPNSCRKTGEINSHGHPVIKCEFVGGDYDEWAKENDSPFTSSGGCELSKECRWKNGLLLAHSECTCTCDGKKTSLADSRCAGYSGVSIG